MVLPNWLNLESISKYKLVCLFFFLIFGVIAFLERLLKVYYVKLFHIIVLILKILIDLGVWHHIIIIFFHSIKVKF